MDLGLLRDLLHDGDGRDHAVSIGIEVPVPLLYGGVAPADGEYRNAGIEQPLEEAAIRSQITQVEAVHLAEHVQHRHRRDLRGGGPILDQLEELVPIHHRAPGAGHILADLEGVPVGYRGVAVVVPEIVQKVFQPASEATPITGAQLFQRLGVSGQAVHRSQHVLEDVQNESRTLAFDALESRLIEPTVQGSGPCNVGLSDPSENGVGFPSRITETLVFRRRRQLAGSHHDAAQLAT